MNLKQLIEFRAAQLAVHVVRRWLGLHPMRRKGERHYDSTVEVVQDIRHDLLHGRRRGDVVDVRGAKYGLDGPVKQR